MDGLKSSDVAKRAKVNVETLRYYEREGLLRKPPRTETNYRIYPEEAVKRVRFIKHAQELGFSLKEVKELLSLQATPGTGCADVLRRAQRKIEEIDRKIRSLKGMRLALSKLMAECTGTGPVSRCPILSALD
jgi:MerR family mercuric resistance operon transcriptional regulator